MTSNLRHSLAALLLAAALALTSTPAMAQPSTTSVDHWGAYGHTATHFLTSPVPIALPGTVVQVATSNSTQYALLADGTVWAWGDGTEGQFGNGGTADSPATAVQVQFPAGVSIAYLPTDAMPFDTGLAVDTQGNAWGWGLNLNGELCLGDKARHLTPVQLPFADVTTLAGAGSHASYDAGGTVYACGSNRDGQTGLGTTQGSALTPQPVPGLTGLSIVSLVASFANSGALLADGSYYTCGLNNLGQDGTGTAGKPVTTPRQVSLPGPVVQVALGGGLSTNGQTLALLAGGTVEAWGSDGSGQLGDGQAHPAQATPEQITPPAGVTYTALATGGQTSYGISSLGAVYVWGDNTEGEAGNGTSGGVVLEPEQVDSGASRVSATAFDVAVG